MTMQQENSIFIMTDDAEVFQSLVDCGFTPASPKPGYSRTGYYIVYNDQNMKVPQSIRNKCVFINTVCMAKGVI